MLQKSTDYKCYNPDNKETIIFWSSRRGAVVNESDQEP